MDKIRQALFQNNLETILQLLKDGEPWDLDPFTTNQLLDKALKQEDFELFDWLIEKEIISLDIFEYDNFRNSIFELFTKAQLTEKGQEYLSKIIADVDNIDDEINGKTWLGLAIEQNASPEFFEILLSNGCDINTIDSKEQTYLFYTKDKKMTEFLINQGIDINKKRVDGRTVFYEVVASKDTELIQLYLDNGIEVNSQDQLGDTVYSIVCFRLRNNEILQQIANYDPPNFDLKNREGQSIFFEFISKLSDWDAEENIVETMLNHGADLFREETDGYGNIKTAADYLAIQPAAAISFLLKINALDVEQIDNYGNSWLHKVCMEDLNFEQKNAQELYKKVKILLKAGANPNLKNDKDKSPIDYAQDDNLKSKALAIMLKK